MTGAEPRGYGDLPACIGVIALHAYAPSTPNYSEKKSSFFFLLLRLPFFPPASSPFLHICPLPVPIRCGDSSKAHMSRNMRERAPCLNKEAIDPAHIRKEGTNPKVCERKTLFVK